MKETKYKQNVTSRNLLIALDFINLNANSLCLQKIVA